MQTPPFLVTSERVYEDAIKRRGRYVEWYTASSCFCVSNNGLVDPNCPSCYGKGFLYNITMSYRRIISGVGRGKKEIVFDAVDVNIGVVNHLYVNGVDVSIESCSHNTITVEQPIPKGVPYTLDYTQNREVEYTGTCSYAGNGYVVVPIEHVVNHTKYADTVVRVKSLKKVIRTIVDDEEVVTYQQLPVHSFWNNIILTNNLLSTDELLVDCVYVQCYQFLITEVAPETRMENPVAQEANMQMTFPGYFTMGIGDLITLQSGEIRETVNAENTGTTWMFPQRNIVRIERVVDRYGDIKDYFLSGGNVIVWGSRTPKKFSVTYTYRPTFSIMESLPSLRGSEDKRWPQMVFLKKHALFDTDLRTLTKYVETPDSEGIIQSPGYVAETGGII